MNDEKKKSSTFKTETEIMKTAITRYEDKINQLNQSKQNPREAAQSNISQFIERKLREMEDNLKESILKEITNNSQQLDEKMNAVMDSASSYANAVNKTTTKENSLSQFPCAPTADLRTIIREDRNDQLAELAEQKQRACNFIVHGVPECPDFKVKDKLSIIRLLQTIGQDTNFVSIDRLGKKDDTSGSSKRPIKVVMRSAKDKDLVMANLINLKGNAAYRSISITDDYTPKERQTRNEWVVKAREANEAEPSDSMWVWRARGSPKNGMFLKKFKKRF